MDLKFNKSLFIGKNKSRSEGEALTGTHLPVVACREQKCQQFVEFDLTAQAV